jgi:hypothetical protein
MKKSKKLKFKKHEILFRERSGLEDIVITMVMVAFLSILVVYKLKSSVL